MSTHVIICCGRCNRSAPNVHTSNLSVAREAARNEGWERRRFDVFTDDLCPACILNVGLTSWNVGVDAR